MNIKSLYFALLFVPTQLMAQTNIGYTNESVARSNIFRYKSNTDQRLAMRLSAEKLQSLKGKTIKSIRLAFGSKNSTDSKATLFLTEALGGAPLREMEVTISTPNKFLEYALPSPYTITGDEKELYVGCQLNIASSYGPFSSDFSKDIKNVFFAYNEGTWNDIYGLGYGCPNIEVVLNEDANLTDVVIKPFEEDGYVKEGDDLSYTLQVQNFGSTTINSFDAIVNVGNGESKTFSFTDCSIAPHKTYNFDLKDINVSSTGRQDINVLITNVNGGADSDVSDNRVKANAYFYPNDMEKNLLVEVFTGQACSNCPNGHTALASAITQVPDAHVVEIAHHSGYKVDIFSMKEDWNLISLYNGSTYAPAIMYNRSLMGETMSPVNECYSVSEIKNYLNKANKARPYVSIAVDSKLDEASRNVNLKCKFYTHEQMPGDDLRYSIWLVQDNIVAAQGGATGDYVHNAVSRGCITEGSWGEQCSFVPGETIEIEKTFNIPEIIASTYYEKEDGKNNIAAVLKDMKIVVFVHQQSSDNVAGCQIFNSAEVALGESSHQGGFPAEKVRVLKSQTYFGDSQGFESNDVATRKLEYCYNDANNVLRKIETSKNTNEDSWQLTHYYIYDYDAPGNLTQSHSLQYGTFDYDELGWMAANDTVSYEYNDKGQLTKESHPLKYYTYEYDEADKLVKRNTWNINSISHEATNDLIETYSDFNAQGNPCSVTAVSPTGKEWNEFTGTYTYDTDGNLTAEKRYSNETPAVLMYAEYWNYVDGRLAEHILPTVFGDGAEVDNVKEVYTLVDGNEDKVMHEMLQANDDGTWSKAAGSLCIDEYAYLSAAPSPELSVTSSAEAINSASLSVENAKGSEVVFFRNGLVVDSVACNGGSASTVETEVKNGTYEYLAVVDGRASNVVTYTYDTTLPAVSNVRYLSERKDLFGNTFVTVQWDNPAVDSRLGFVCRNLMYENMRTEEMSTTDANANTFEIDFGSDRVKNLYIQTRYKIGRANSSIATIDLDNLSSCIDALDSDSADSITYDIQGRQVLNPSRGIYIRNGKKVVVK